MNDDMTESPTLARRATDVALLLVAFVAVAAWVFRRLRRPATVDATGAAQTQPADDKGGTVDTPSNAPV